MFYSCKKQNSISYLHMKSYNLKENYKINFSADRADFRIACTIIDSRKCILIWQKTIGSRSERRIQCAEFAFYQSANGVYYAP